MKNLLVVVDMVNGFINEGALADEKINKITPNIVDLIENSIGNGDTIVAFKDCHSIDDKEFEIFPSHCIKGSNESELIPELKKYEQDMIVIEKNTTNGFVTEKFTSLVSKVEFDDVLVVGCCTDICVNGFVNSYLEFNRMNNRKTKIRVDSSSCYTFDGEGHDAELMHKKALGQMESNGAVVVDLYPAKRR